MAKEFRAATEVGCACVTVPGDPGCSCTVTVTDANGKHVVLLGDNFANSNVAFAAGADWTSKNTGIELAPATAGA